jgi:hypothetical protein
VFESSFKCFLSSERLSLVSFSLLLINSSLLLLGSFIRCLGSLSRCKGSCIRCNFCRGRFISSSYLLSFSSSLSGGSFCSSLSVVCLHLNTSLLLEHFHCSSGLLSLHSSENGIRSLLFCFSGSFFLNNSLLLKFIFGLLKSFVL